MNSKAASIFISDFCKNRFRHDSFLEETIKDYGSET